MKTSRRDILQLGALAWLAPAAEAVAAPAPSKEDWIDAALRPDPTKGTAVGALRMARFRDPFYYLTAPISWTPDPVENPGLPKVVAPTGFVTDLASIPQPFWNVLPPDGDYLYAAVLHDYLYWTQTCTRAQADGVLEAVMRDFSIPWLTLKVIFHAVALAGTAAWNGNSKARAAGERRILAKQPTDPLVRWKDWKTRPDVFA